MDNPNPAKESELENFAWAVKTGDMNNVQRFIDNRIFTAKSTDQNGRTPLHWAADFNQVEVIQYLLGKGGNVNAKDNYGITPLLAAVYENHPNAVKVLVGAGADKKVKGPDDLTALEAAESAEIKNLLK